MTPFCVLMASRIADGDEVGVAVAIDVAELELVSLPSMAGVPRPVSARCTQLCVGQAVCRGPLQ
jgi:hypothetical protein